MKSLKPLITIACIGLVPMICSAAEYSDPKPLVSNGADTPASEYNDYLIHFIANDTKYCTGQFISPKFILTNAHCVDIPDPFGEPKLSMDITVFGGMNKFDYSRVVAQGTVPVHRLVHRNMNVIDEYLDYFNPIVNAFISRWTNELYGEQFNGKMIFEGLAPSLYEGASDLALIEMNTEVPLTSIALPQRSLKLEEGMSFDDFKQSSMFANKSWIMRGFGSSGYDDVPDPTVLQQFKPNFVIDPHLVECTFYTEGDIGSRMCDGDIPMVNEGFGVRITPRIEALSLNNKAPEVAAQPGDSGSGVYESGTDNLYSIATHLYESISEDGRLLWANGMVTLDHVLFEIARVIDDIVAPTDVYLDSTSDTSVTFAIQNHTLERVTFDEMVGNLDLLTDCGSAVEATESCLITIDFSDEIAHSPGGFTHTINFSNTSSTKIHVGPPADAKYSSEISGGSTGPIALLMTLLLGLRRKSLWGR
ncbi:trypsin-like serine protease [Vibrio penaeicida]|uniref:Peptidase S1 domain-containing protein n=1 Tax=Vibrio penaeicida TaxID=104609 RepID=A0AAV5NKV3_9VIBR|nr:trypsin-like serine protease [Vibrio penaeicida]RTZ24953.1 trypsin-like serine protease [Vibrio penaeicida]GLQ71241.1 hypothetical protein GCM10007932_06010 [Vibrio penaeicida]